ncbi:MAG: nitronate monooxygenase, partial [Leptolyngbya sp.]|nr:nitronate monooxygenase [Candidatus Melainabacteria bacterium]
MTEIASFLKIKYPIIQAPMAGSDNPQFVAAASSAGVLGSLGAQYRTPEEIEKAITEIRRLTDKPFAVNLFAPVSREIPNDKDIELAKNALEKYYKKFDAK